MKKLSMTVAALLILTSSLVFAQQNSDSGLPPNMTAVNDDASAMGLITIEAVNDDGSVFKDPAGVPGLNDKDLKRAACCVQPEINGFPNRLISIIESLASIHTFNALISNEYKKVCNKVQFFTALNLKPELQQLRSDNSAGLVLQVRAKDIKSPSLLSCLSKSQ